MCSPTELQRHRRALHKGRRVSSIEEKIEVNDFVELEDIVEVIDCNGDDYLCVMEDNEDVEWMKLPPSHPLIAKFLKERSRLQASIHDGPIEIPHNQLGEFMSSVFEDI